MATVREVQQRLISLGFPLPRFGADGDAGGETLTAINGALDELVTLRGGSKPAPAPPVASKADAVVPADWMPAAKMDRIIYHWTAGTHKAAEFDRGHYHILIEADGDGSVRGAISADTTNDQLVFVGVATGAASVSAFFTASYVVI